MSGADKNRENRENHKSRENHKKDQDGPDIGPLRDVTGNGTVDNGPENELNGRDDAGADDAAGGDAAGDSAADGEDDAVVTRAFPAIAAAAAPDDTHGADDAQDAHNDLNGLLDGDELALRRLMLGAVGELKPSEGALDHLRKAVPTRRARKRQAVVGMAAAALLFGTAIPAFVHVANSTSTDGPRPIAAGHGEEAQGGTGADKDSGGGKKDKDHPSDKVSEAQDDPEESEKPATASAGSAEGGRSGGTSSRDDAASDYTAKSMSCGASQLTVTAQEAGAPDASGKVYGTFRITNVSGSACTVTGSGTVGIGTGGAADGSRVGVASHMAGDEATGLPDPSLAVASLSLAPNGSYEVKFAWVPSDTCPTSGASPAPSTSEDTSGGVPGGGDGGTVDNGGAGSESQLGGDEGTLDGSVYVSHTTAAGAPTASATIPNACAGTVYRTGLLSAS
ncbi:DUF4232 domain-containing protein [Streptomyces sp. NPDC091212]|uniref:DUF4232 domain-containing protein n=1 Tax=Streptomyces sp. NPDC091212 TaxID=3155191 RepID=UPI003417C289